MNTNLVKGILIALVIIDHNDFSRALFAPFLKGFSFHVVAFFALPFLRAPTPLSAASLQRHFYRLYYPFLIAALVTSAVFWASTGRAVADASLSLLVALYNGNADSLKAATNMGLLWFLPSFFSFMIVKNALDSIPRLVRQTLYAVLILAHLCIGAVATTIQDYLPLGLLPALYLLPLGCLIAMLHRHVCCRLRRDIALAVTLLLFVPIKYLQIRLSLGQEVGFSQVADYTDIAALVVNDLEAIVGVLLVFQVGRFSFSTLVEQIGHVSLQVYLFHAFLSKALFVAVMSVPFTVSPSIGFFFTATLTLLASTKLAQSVSRIQLFKQFLFPETRRELLGKMPPLTVLK